MGKINWGISENLQADVRYEPNACKGYVMDISLGCGHQCIYCLFSPLELLAYKVKNPAYEGNVLPLELDNFLARQDFPPAVYMCYSSDPLGGISQTKSTMRVVKKLFDHNVSILFITKGRMPDEFLELVKARPDLMEIQIGITSHDATRNKTIEPGAPSYEERLDNFRKLATIEKLGSLTVRMDPLFPRIDDNPENISRVLKDVSDLGGKEAVFGYIILTPRLKEELSRYDFLRASIATLTERTKTISEQELYSFPFSEKLQQLQIIEELCKDYGIKMSLCACKDKRLKETSYQWICHPFNRQRRQELANDTPDKEKYFFKVEHL